MNNNNDNGRKIHLTLKNHWGSVEHYYHFLFGFLMPLALEQKKINAPAGDILFIRSCAIMDEHLNAIGFDGVEIVDSNRHNTIKIESYSDVSTKTVADEFIELWGYDDPDYYSYDKFCDFKSILMTSLSNDIAKFSKQLKAYMKDDTPRVIMINREPSDPFYLSQACEIKTAGDIRRSIPNFDSLFTAVGSEYKNTISVTLQGKSLAYQIALFKHADVIIAQHGAALANIIWCDSSAKVIEIHPDDMLHSIQNKDFFRNLALCMHNDYRRVIQSGSHSNVDAELVLSAIRD